MLPRCFLHWQHISPTLRASADGEVPGVKSYDVSLEKQKVDVVAAEALGYTDVLEKIKKTGKTVSAGEADGEKMAV